MKTMKEEQKPAEWSEEDELTIADLINYFEGDTLKCSAEEMVQRIKSLRPQLKRKQSPALKKIVDNLSEEKLAKTRAEMKTVEEEPEKVNCPFDKGDCRYCTVQFCGARENVTTITTSTSLPVVEEKPVDFEKLALEKYPETMTYDSRGLYDRKKYDRDIYKQGLKDGYNLKHKIRNDDNNL